MWKVALTLAFLNLLFAGRTQARENLWLVPSSNHEQTFAYGSERHHQWINRNGHLALYIEFTNDPYVDRINIRQYDDFEFEFPLVRVGVDGRTFYFRPPHGSMVPVATTRPWQGINLLPSSFMIIQKIHGRVTIILNIQPARDSS